MSDLLLERSEWDLIASAAGDIAVCDEPYAVAQAVANECKLFLGEGYYDATQGIPYDADVFNSNPNISLIETLMQTAAQNVPNVVSARAVLYLDRTTRTVKGAVLTTTTDGVDLSVGV